MGMKLFAAAISEHPVTATAVGEVTGQVLETVGDAPDLAMLFVTLPHAGALEDAARAVRAVLHPVALVGCAAVAVVGPGREVEAAPAVSLWAGRVGAVAAVAWSGREPPPPPPFSPRALALVGDPFSFPADEAFDAFAHAYPGIPVTGGMASGAHGPGGNRLLLDDRVLSSGAVGAWIGSEVGVETIVSQGCRPVGVPLTVTKGEGQLVHELAGRAALTQLFDMAQRDLTPQEVELVNSGGLHVGRVIDEHKADFGPGDFLVRNVLGADRETGSIAVGDDVSVGATLQFHLRDAGTADEELRRLLAPRSAEAGLLFTCTGRGVHLFGKPHHDARLLAEALDDAPVAGFFAQGEFGEIGGRNFVHGYTASIALMTSR